MNWFNFLTVIWVALLLVEVCIAANYLAWEIRSKKYLKTQRYIMYALFIVLVLSGALAAGLTR